jgi:hypothetical protein
VERSRSVAEALAASMTRAQAYARPMRYALAALALLAGCSAPPKVDWDDYPSGTKERIDRTAEAKRCDFLKAELDNAKRMDDADSLKAYVEAKMKAAGCDK